MPKELPSPELLRKLLRYEPETGKLFWRKRTKEIHANDHTRRAFNTRFAGKEAFTCDDGRGYRYGGIMGVAYKAHRVIWAIYYGNLNDQTIDHINGDRSDNRIDNLRNISLSNNMRNKKIPRSNTSGFIGVSGPSKSGSWLAYITYNKSRIHLGSFATAEEASIARRAAEHEYGFHRNHGSDRPEYNDR